MLVRVPLLLYSAQAVECVLAVVFGKNYDGSSPTIGIFLYVAQAVECMLTVAFGTHNTHKRQTSTPPVGFEPIISAGEGL